MKKLDSVSVKLFKNLLTVNLFVSIGLLIICFMTGKLGSAVFGIILFTTTLGVYMVAHWHDQWDLEKSKRAAYVSLAIMLVVSLFIDSRAFTAALVLDIILADLLFSRYVTNFRKGQNRAPIYIVGFFLSIVLVDEVFNVVNPNIHQYSRWVDMVIYLFVVVKLIYASSILYAESRRMAIQRKKEEQFIDYSAEFNNFFSHYINTPLTTAMSNIEIARLKTKKVADDEVLNLISGHFTKIEEGLLNVSKTTKELALIHYIRSEVLRNGVSRTSLERYIKQIVREHDLEFEQVIDTWPDLIIPTAMVEFTIDQIISNAQVYATDQTVPRVVVHVQDGFFVFSVFNKGNIPMLEDDILHPFKRGRNTLEGTGTGLGLSLVNDLMEDYKCGFSLDNVGAHTRCQLKLPLYKYDKEVLV